MKSWGSDTCSTNEVDLCSHEFIKLVPHGAVNMCFPEERFELW